MAFFAEEPDLRIRTLRSCTHLGCSFKHGGGSGKEKEQEAKAEARQKKLKSTSCSEGRKSSNREESVPLQLCGNH